MTDEKRVKDEELANITGGNCALELGDCKKPPGGGGPAGEGPETKGDGGSQPSDWQPS